MRVIHFIFRCSVGHVDRCIDGNHRQVLRGAFEVPKSESGKNGSPGEQITVSSVKV